MQSERAMLWISFSLPVLGLKENLGGDLALDDAAEKAGGVGGHGE